MKTLKNTLFYSFGLMLTFIVFACSNDDNGGEDSSNTHHPSGDAHTYEIYFDNGKELKGSVSKYLTNFYYSYTFIEYNPETNGDRLTMVLIDQANNLEIGLGVNLDENNNPIIDGETSVFVIYELDENYGYITNNFTATFSNYQKFIIDYYEDELEVATFTLELEGAISNTITGEAYKYSCVVTIAAN